jgi:hypothetical protein
MLVAYLDDSGSNKEGPVMVLAGWVSRFIPWMDFSDEWQLVLDECPKLRYFKLKEAVRREEQFGRLSPKQRDERTLKFFSLIQKHVGFGVVASFRWSDLKIAQRECPPDMALDSYQVLFHGIMATVVYEVLRIDSNGRVLFVFDVQGGSGRNAEAVFNWVRPRLPERLRKAVIGISEVDDEIILPVQAADSLAWLMRRHADKNPRCTADLGDWRPMESYLEPLRSIPRIHTHYPLERLRKIIEDYKRGGVLE